MKKKSLFFILPILTSFVFSGCNTKSVQPVQGEQGAPGEKGETGKDGASVLTGNGVPSNSLGNLGDSYIDLSTWDYYVKEETGWVLKGNIQGVQGPSGQDGSDGNDGQTGPQGPAGQDGQNGQDGVDGVSVVSIVKTGSEGLVDTYTITYSDGHTSTFTVTNGAQGSQGIQGEPGADGHTPVITISEDGYWVVDGIKTTTLAQGPQGEQGEPGQSGISIINSTIDDNGHLIIELSSGEYIDAGKVKDPDDIYTVTFDSNGGSEVASQQVLRGSLLTKPDNPTKENYGFDGWYTGDGDKWIFKGCAVYENMTLYANWIPNSYTITYHLNGGTNSFNNPNYYFQGTETISLENPTKNYSTFEGWYLDEDFTQPCSEITSTMSGNIDLYAKFESILYTIKFNTNGGTAISDAVGAYGTQFPAVSTTKSGYIFSGWYKDSSFNTPYSLPDTFPALNLIIYAKWERITYKVYIAQTSSSNAIYVCPAQNTTNAISSSGKSFVMNSLTKTYFCWKYWDYNNSTTVSTWKNYTPAATTTQITLVLEGDAYGSSAKVTIKELNSSGVITKTSTVTLTKS